MRGIILLNGEPWQGEIEDGNAFVVCCDGALRWAKGRVRIDVTAGDFDSLGYVPQGAQVFPVEKDSTDGEIALQMLLSRGCRQIDIYGGGGGREDHLFGNLQLLVAAHRAGAKPVMVPDLTPPDDELRSICAAVVPTLADVIPLLDTL